MSSEWVDTKRLASMMQMSETELSKLLKQSPVADENESASDQVKLSTLFLDKHGIKIYQEDFLNTSSLPPSSIDLIVTSPPYNVGIDYSAHDDANEYNSYLEFSRRWLTKSYEASRLDGRLCMNIPLDKNKGGQQSVCADLTTIAKEIGWQYHSTIIWNEGNISRRTAWGSWMSASAPFVIAPVEVIVVMYKRHWKKDKRSTQLSDITRDEFMAWTNGMWTFNGESKKKIGHPAPFPRELPKRCIKLFSFVGDTVLDPFMGSGTTLLEAYAHQRQGIGFDIAADYCRLTQKRLSELWDHQQPRLL
jgi:site-specific DNA-methyltransferase (adenine-specific)